MYPETILPIAAHIPHAGTVVPEAVRDQFLPWAGELWREIAMVTDWYTDELFRIPGIAVTQTPISRVVVDLERYADDSLEKNAVYGMGVIYTRNTPGRADSHRAIRARARVAAGQLLPPLAPPAGTQRGTATGALGALPAAGLPQLP